MYYIKITRINDAFECKAHTNESTTTPTLLENVFVTVYVVQKRYIT